MLLRSSSTPVLGSLLSSFSESPNNNTYHQSELHGPTSKHTTPTRLTRTNGSHGFAKSLFHSPSVAEIKSPHNGFRRVQSEGNLEELANASYNVDEFAMSKKFARKPHCSNLEAIPSFSLNSLGTRYEDDDDEYDSDSEDELELEESGNVSYTVENYVMDEVRTSNVNGYSGLRFEGEGKMYLAAGLGVSGISFVDISGGGGGGGGGFRPVGYDRDGGDSRGISMEEHYKRMLEGDPGNPLVLRNYAQFLYQQKGDLKGAEEYYSRAILADPEDGEILSEYAKLTWELHHDKERALNYFERAVQVSSEDSHIHAAYASFLWDVDDEEDEQENGAETTQLGAPFFHHGLLASTTAPA